MQILFSDACCTLMAPEMVILNPATQVQRLYCRADNIKSDHCFHITHCSRRFVKVSNVRKQSRLPSAFNSARPRPNSISQCLVCRTVWGFELQMERMMLKLAGNFSIPSRAPNEDLKTPLESLDSLDVDRLFRHEKRIFYDREI
jgi:hypothetical protein